MFSHSRAMYFHLLCAHNMCKTYDYLGEHDRREIKIKESFSLYGNDKTICFHEGGERATFYTRYCYTGAFLVYYIMYSRLYA